MIKLMANGGKKVQIKFGESSSLSNQPLKRIKMKEEEENKNKKK